MEYFEYVTPKNLGSLICMLPTLISWLRHEDPKSANFHLMKAGKLNISNQYIMVEFALKALLAGVNGRNIVMSTNELRQIFSSFDVSVWAECIVLILGYSEPRVIDKVTRKALIQTASEQGTTKARVFQKPLRKMNPFMYPAMGCLCSSISQTSKKNMDSVCSVLGPIILLDPLIEDKYHPIASEVLKVLSENHATLFQMPRRAIQNEFGLRPSNLESFHASAVSRRKEHLRLFYRVCEPDYMPLADEFFKHHKFVDIAKGLYRKYQRLPVGWKKELEALKKNNGEKNLAWFDSEKIKFLSELTTKLTPPVEIDFSHLAEDNTRNKVDHIVDELVDSEKTYFKLIETFVTSYVYEIRSISQGKLGVDAQAALGLSKRQVEYIFGQRMYDLIDMEKKMIMKMEVLAMVRAPTIEKMGRAGIIADIILEMGPLMKKVYGPYVYNYNKVREMLEEAQKALELLKKRSNRSNVEATSAVFKALNFEQIWEEIATIKVVLMPNKANLQSILFAPIARLPRYKLFFDRIQKTIGEKHPAYEKVKRAGNVLLEVTSDVDKDIKEQEAFQLKMFGEITGGV